jgi:hypothetical protein
MSYKN